MTRRKPVEGSGHAGSAMIPPGIRGRKVWIGAEELVVFELPLPRESDLGAATLEKLTPAEQEVAGLVLRGSSNAEIAARRGTAESTSAKQIETIYRKLGVASRAELAALVSHVSRAPRRRAPT